jgi:hypothetical protein
MKTGGPEARVCEEEGLINFILFALSAADDFIEDFPVMMSDNMPCCGKIMCNLLVPRLCWLDRSNVLLQTGC